ncbi:hypothetical protein SAMN04487846_3441 [Microbacterium sp. cf046]|nr:hypothetical protein SAMN04487846_3441 [Microbacterium sp. cf046]
MATRAEFGQTPSQMSDPDGPWQSHGVERRRGRRRSRRPSLAPGAPTADPPPQRSQRTAVRAGRLGQVARSHRSRSRSRATCEASSYSAHLIIAQRSYGTAPPPRCRASCPGIQVSCVTPSRDRRDEPDVRRCTCGCGDAGSLHPRERRRRRVCGSRLLSAELPGPARPVRLGLPTVLGDPGDIDADRCDAAVCLGGSRLSAASGGATLVARSDHRRYCQDNVRRVAGSSPVASTHGGVAQMAEHKGPRLRSGFLAAESGRGPWFRFRGFRYPPRKD